MIKALSLLSVLVNGKLTVYSPLALADTFSETHGEIQSQMANFGHIPYG
jgi:hypothetical protein